MSNLSLLFDDLESTLVDKQQLEVELKVPPGVYKYTVSHSETTSLPHPVNRMLVSLTAGELDLAYIP